jgi:fatty acid-binding protein DegV
MTTHSYNLRNSKYRTYQAESNTIFDRDLSNMISRITRINELVSIDRKVLLIIKMLKYIDKNGRLRLILDPLNKYLQFKIIFKNKLIDFKNINKLSKYSKDLKNLSLKLLKKWFGENHTPVCCAIKKNNMLCDKLITDDTINIIHNVCKIHKNYPLKVLNILDKYLPNNISKHIILPMIF